MVSLQPRSGIVRRSRWRSRAAGAVALLATVAAVWYAPAVIVKTTLRDRPLAAVFAGIDGRVTSRGATWRWWGGSEYRDVALTDHDGRPLVTVRRVMIDRGLGQLLVRPHDPGAVRLEGVEALLEVRRGGSGLEDVLAPWLASLPDAPASAAAFDLELVDAAVELVDLEHDDAWRITDVTAAGTWRPDGTLAGWTVAGRARHAGRPVRDVAVSANRVAAPAAGPREPAARPSDRLDRTRVAAGSTAAIARDGGWSVSSPAVDAPLAPRTITVAATRLPLGVSSVAATRFAAAQLLDGVADVRLDITLPPGAPVRVAGTLAGTELAICRADTLAEVVALDRAEMPFDVAFDGHRAIVRSLRLASPLFRADATGRLRLPRAAAWDWAEAQIGEDFAVTADVDLAAVARSVAGGLAVRPDVRVTGGTVHLGAAARNDGRDRVLEIRATARDLSAVQAAVAEGGGRQERPLRWSEPFTAWLTCRRGPDRDARLVVEEAHLASEAAEISATGDATTSVVQWTVDLEKLVREAREVLALDGVELAGSIRGRLDLDRHAAGDAVHARLSASLADLVLARAGRPAWRDEAVSVEAEGIGTLSGDAILVDRLRGAVSAADDLFEATLAGGGIVGLAAAPGRAGTTRVPWLRGVPGGPPLVADLALSGDLARWQARLEAFTPTASGASLAGAVKATATLAADGGAWQVTRAGAEIEKLEVAFDDRTITEPRAVATGAGRWQPATGTIEIASAEVLTPTLSLRTGGLAMLPGRAGGGTLDTLVDRLRGKVQWQADIGRLEGWLVPPATAARWPASGRGWGTAEVIDTPLGLNVLVEATGSQLVLAGPPGGLALAAGSPPAAGRGGREERPVPLWSEPRAAAVVEVTRPRGPAATGEQLVVNRLALESSTVAVAAAGSIEDWSTRRQVDVGGNVAYDWEQVSRLLAPFTGGRVRLAGGGARPFALRGPLGAASAATAARGDGPDRVPMPEEWLAASGGTPGTLARLPVAGRGTPRPDDLTERLRALSVETTATWTAADVAGFRLEAGEMPLKFFEGQLALGPFDVAAAGGRLRGSPWVRLLPAPAEIVVPPGRCVDRVVLTREVCDRWVRQLLPLVGHSARMQGFMSVDSGGGRIPLADPFAGDASGQVIFENLEAVPAETVQPLANLLARLQTAIDPRFAFGDKAVLLRVRPEPVRVRLVDRRLWHDGLVIDSGQLVVRSAGSVAADGTLAMNVEVAFRGDIAGATPVVGRLLRTPLVIPLKGTVDRPQFDARAVELTLARIVENTADAVFNEGIGKGLEALFGNPAPPTPPPPTPPPLSFPGPAR